MADEDRKRQSSLVVGWFCLVFAVLVMAYSLWLSRRDAEGGPMLLVVALALLVAGIAALVDSRRSAS